MWIRKEDIYSCTTGERLKEILRSSDIDVKIEIKQGRKWYTFTKPSCVNCRGGCKKTMSLLQDDFVKEYIDTESPEFQMLKLKIN